MCGATTHFVGARTQTFEQLQLAKERRSIKRVKEDYRDEFLMQDIAPYLRTHGRFPGEFPNGDTQTPNRSPSPDCGN